MIHLPSLQNCQITITPCDPWDIVSANGSEPRTGIVRKDEQAALLIELDEPISDGATSFRFVVASPRHVGKPLESAVKGGTVSCNVIGVSAEQASSPNPCDLTDWRGGGAFIATFSAV